MTANVVDFQAVDTINNYYYTTVYNFDVIYYYSIWARLGEMPTLQISNVGF